MISPDGGANFETVGACFAIIVDDFYCSYTLQYHIVR